MCMNKKECDRCKRKNIVFRLDKTYFCRSCGYDSRENKK